MQFYRKKGVLQILDNSVTEARNARAEGALGISQFDNHHSTPQFTDRETEVMSGKAYIRGHRARKAVRELRQEPRAPENVFGPLSIRPPCQAGMLMQKWCFRQNWQQNAEEKEVIVQETVKMIPW